LIKRCYIIVSAIIFFSCCLSVFAQGLFGERYIACSTGLAVSGEKELRNVDDMIFRLQVALRVPFNDNTDFSFSLSHRTIEADGYDSISLTPTIRMTYHFTPEKRLNPFVQAQINQSHVSIERTDDVDERFTDDLLSFGLRIGVEYDLTETSAIIPHLGGGYIHDLDDGDYFWSGIALTKWFSDDFGTVVEAIYNMDNDDIITSISLLNRF
jgi:hypothetical protein